MRNWNFSLFILSFVLTFALSGCHREPGIPVGFFYLEVCPGCESYINAESLSERIGELNKSKRYEGRSWNMGIPSENAGEVLKKMIEERNLPDISYALPLLFVGEDYYVGYEDIENRISQLLEEVRGE